MDAVTGKVPQRVCGQPAGFRRGPGVLGALPSPARKKDSVVNTSVSESVSQGKKHHFSASWNRGLHKLE